MNKNNRITAIAALILGLAQVNVQATPYQQTMGSQLNVEENRIPIAAKAMPSVVNRLDDKVRAFTAALAKAKGLDSLSKLVAHHGQATWQAGVSSFKKAHDFDDRPLYWARLKMTRALKQSIAFVVLPTAQQTQLLWQFELISRGQKDINFNRQSTKKILITGFDPFFLDRNINQSNPSGVAALAFDDLLISADDNKTNAEIETLIVPVRFADFDQGMIETLLTPYIRAHNVDMVITISMGRDDFDLERFPGLRRSAKAPGNLNVYTGASAQSPLIPKLGAKPLNGPEFVEFSLPAAAMQQAPGPFKIHDNRIVTTITAKETKQKFAAKSLAELTGQIAVEGGGGGYLSNEISYRSIRLRNLYHPSLPVGHIHTPRFKAFEPAKSAKIVEQIKAMLTRAIVVI